jgi:hypothetical protein
LNSGVYVRRSLSFFPIFLSLPLLYSSLIFVSTRWG